MVLDALKATFMFVSLNIFVNLWFLVQSTCMWPIFSGYDCFTPCCGGFLVSFTVIWVSGICLIHSEFLIMFFFFIFLFVECLDC
jgi:hypothetical protein